MSRTVTKTETLELRNCPKCGAYVALRPDQWGRRQKGEDGLPHLNAYGGYMCPNGHQYGWGTSEMEERAVAAEAEVRRLAAERDGLLGSIKTKDTAIATKDKELARIGKRAAAGVCLQCHRHFTNVERHMASKHGSA